MSDGLMIICVMLSDVKLQYMTYLTSDGQRSDRSTSRVSCKSTELKRCSMIEMRWNKYEVSLASPV